MVCGKDNFSNLSRYSHFSEKTYRRQFEQDFNFLGLNLGVIEAANKPEARLLGVMDSSFIRKSGKKTFGLDWYYNGSATRAERGLEVSQQIVNFYHLRFQIEFLFRDSKQFTRLEDCQSRTAKKFYFHFDSSFASPNLAKLQA